jgi:uncharacterized protein (TIGR04255 family)
MSGPELAEAKRILSRRLPVMRQATVATLHAVAGGPPGLATEQVPKFTSRDRTSTVTFGRESLVVETSAYKRFEDFRQTVELAIEARTVAHPVDGVERLGLRYIDEIRVPVVGPVDQAWAAWVDQSLLGPSVVGPRHGLFVSEWQGIVQFDAGQSRSVVLRYGPREGYAVDPKGDLARPNVPAGPFFLLDIDSFWTASSQIPEFSAAEILHRVDELHAPVGQLFESLITDRLRDEVLRIGGGSVDGPTAD